MKKKEFFWMTKYRIFFIFYKFWHLTSSVKLFQVLPSALFLCLNSPALAWWSNNLDSLPWVSSHQIWKTVLRRLIIFNKNCCRVSRAPPPPIYRKNYEILTNNSLKLSFEQIYKKYHAKIFLSILGFSMNLFCNFW